MFFLLTNFIYPLKNPISLSKYFGFEFDNPRSNEEIKTVHNLIVKSWKLSETVDSFRFQRFPLKKEVPDQDVVTFEMLIEEFLRKYYGKKIADRQLKEIEGNKNKVIDFYTRNWVIVRYQNKEMLEEEKRMEDFMKKERQAGKPGIFLLEDDHMFEKKEKQLINYSHLVSFLAGGKDYFGWNFLLTKSRYDALLFNPDVHIMDTILKQSIGLNAKRDSNSAEYYFDIFWDSVKKTVNTLDLKMKDKLIDENILLYIGDILESTRPSENSFSALVRIVSIIELLLTHQPDFSRFNVEDSITKQFVLKTAILIQKENSESDLEKIKSKLKLIYTQRSNIVHGNFDSVNKFVEELRKKAKYFDSLVTNSYRFARTVLRSYIQDPKFVQFLKEN